MDMDKAEDGLVQEQSRMEENPFKMQADPDVKNRNIAVSSTDIAVIGMAGRFPGSSNIDEFWDHLMAGEEGIVRLTEEELSAAGVGPEEYTHSDYVRAKGVLQNTEFLIPSF